MSNKRMHILVYHYGEFWNLKLILPLTYRNHEIGQVFNNYTISHYPHCIAPGSTQGVDYVGYAIKIFGVDFKNAQHTGVWWYNVLVCQEMV